MPKPKLDLKEFESRDRLTEEDIARIADAGIAEADGEVAEETTEPEETTPPPVEKSTETPEDDKEKESETPEEKPEGGEEETPETPAEETTTPPVETSTSQKKEDAEAEVSTYAEEHGITLDEAKEHFEHFAKILEKHGGDAKKLAQNYYHLQRRASQADDELKKLKEEQPVREAEARLTPEVVIEQINAGQITSDGKALSREQIVEMFRTKYPDLTEDLDDERVVKLAAKDIRQHLLQVKSNQLTQLKSKATEKRAKLMQDLPETLKAMRPDIKAVLDKTPDAIVSDERFNLADTINWARGKYFTDQRIAEIKAQEFKRGQESAKILGVKQTGTPPATPSAKSGKFTYKLTAEQKEEAESMFQSVKDSMPKEEMYQEFYELYVKE